MCGRIFQSALASNKKEITKCHLLMNQKNEVQGELFPLPIRPKKLRARRSRRKTAKGPPKEIGQYMPDIPPG